MVKKIVLYHGSLEELNSRDPNKQYRFAEELSYVSSKPKFIEDIDNVEEITSNGWDGLVNKRCFSFPSSSIIGYLEGTPIIRVEN